MQQSMEKWSNSANLKVATTQQIHSLAFPPSSFGHCKQPKTTTTKKLNDGKCMRLAKSQSTSNLLLDSKRYLASSESKHLLVIKLLSKLHMLGTYKQLQHYCSHYTLLLYCHVGPMGWPVLGSLPELITTRENAGDKSIWHKYYRKYGPIYQLKISYSELNHAFSSLYNVYYITFNELCTASWFMPPHILPCAHTHTHAHAHAQAHTHTHAHAHTLLVRSVPNAVVISDPVAAANILRAEGKYPSRMIEENMIWIHRKNNLQSSMLFSWVGITLQLCYWPLLPYYILTFGWLVKFYWLTHIIATLQLL